MNDEKRKISTTTDGKPPRPGFENAAAPAPARADGQNEAYWVLSEEERAKGFVRPVRRAYKHVGLRPKYPTRDLTDHEKEMYAGVGYVQFEEYPPSDGGPRGRFYTQAQLTPKCGGSLTTMGLALCETYARDPSYYGSTFCVACRAHFPVGEFRWDEDGQVVGS